MRASVIIKFGPPGSSGDRVCGGRLIDCIFVCREVWQAGWQPVVLLLHGLTRMLIEKLLICWQSVDWLVGWLAALMSFCCVFHQAINSLATLWLHSQHFTSICYCRHTFIDLQTAACGKATDGQTTLSFSHISSKTSYSLSGLYIWILCIQLVSLHFTCFLSKKIKLINALTTVET